MQCNGSKKDKTIEEKIVKEVIKNSYDADNNLTHRCQHYFKITNTRKQIVQRLKFIN